MEQRENYKTETHMGKVEIGMKGDLFQELRVGWGIDFIPTHFCNFGMRLKFRWLDLEPSMSKICWIKEVNTVLKVVPVWSPM